MLSLPQRLAIALEIKRRELGNEAHDKYYDSLFNFVRDAWHLVEPYTPFVDGWHIHAMCQHLEAVTRGEIQNLLINVPPGMLKSLLVGVFWPCWEWGARKLANYRYICAGHSLSLSVRDNIKARRLILSDWYQDRFSHVRLTSDQKAKIKYENTKLGFREATAAGSITGTRGDRVILDDPLSVADSYSDTVREQKATWFLEAVPLRINDVKKSSIVVVMQRLHDEDTSGIILDRKLDYVHLCLPMEFEPDRCCKTKIGFVDPRKKEGELLFPERFPRDAVNEKKITLGEYATAGQFQQSPVPKGGGIIKSAWIKVLDVVPASFTYTIQSYDLAFKDGENNDYSVGTTWGMLDDKIYLVDLIRGKWQFPELVAKAQSYIAKFNTNIILIEDHASGISLIQTLKKQLGGRLKPVRADTNKVARTHAVTHLFENGHVYIKRADWNEEYIKEISRFPYAAHDDQVDSTTQAVRFFDKIRNQQFKNPQWDVMSR